MTWSSCDHWTSAWLRGGEITQPAWVDNQVLAWSSGVHLVFFDLSSNTQSVYVPSKADGVCCVAGKASQQLLAFAERNSTPSIFIYKFPEMKLIAECLQENQIYLSIEFAKDFLISVAYSSLIIWSLSGTKLLTVETLLTSENQIIKVAETPTISIAHLGEKLIVWKLFSSKLLLTKEEIVFPSETSAVYVDWSSDDQLAIVDKHGHIYIKNKEEITRVVLSQRCGVCLDYEIPSVCWYLGGLMLKTTFCQMRFYMKQKNIWRRQQYFKSEHKPRFFLRHPLEEEKLYYLTTDGFLMELKISDCISNEVKFYFGGMFKFVDLVYPWGDRLAAVEGSRLSIMSTADGNQVGTLDFNFGGKVSGLKSHLDHPLLAITFESGELVIVSVHDRPVLVYKFNFQSKLDFGKFSVCGRHVVTAEASGNCFCVSSDQKLYSKIDRLKIKRTIVDINCCVVQKKIKIFALLLTAHKSGNLVAVYGLPEIFEQVIELPKVYQGFEFVGNSLKFVASPFLSKEIHFFELEDNGVKLSDCWVTTNRLRGLRLTANRCCITAAGSDGLITILSRDSRVALLSHHRKDLGVSEAICWLSKDLVIALGRNGSLVCLKTTVTASKRSDHLSVSSIYQLPEQCQVVPSDGRSWVDWSKEQKELKQEQDSKENKIQIQQEFKELKDKIKQMLDFNEQAEEIQRLPVAAFDIAREQKIKIAKEEREDLKLKIKFECKEMEKVSRWISEKFGEVKSKMIGGFSGSFVVRNFSGMEEPEDVLWIDELGSSVKVYVNTRINSEESKRYSVVKSRYKSSRDEKSVIESLMIDEEEDEVRMEEERASMGTTTATFIQTYFQSSQFEDYSFKEFFRVNQRLLEDVKRLEEYFNGIFEEIYTERSTKVEELAEMKRKLKFISEEMENLFGKKLLDDSMQDFEEIELGDDERNKLIDYFREKTIEMMDCEVNWEDLKKEVPILENFEGTEQNLKRKYEEEVYKLNFLKERYRRILESEYQKTLKALQEIIFDFDKKFNEFFGIKIKIDAAIGQINLLRVRGMIRFVERFKMMKKIEEVEVLIDEKKEKLKEILGVHERMKDLALKFKEERQEIEEEGREFWKKARKEIVGRFGRETFEEMKKELKGKTSVQVLAMKNELECLDLSAELMEKFVSPEKINSFVGLKRKKVEIELRLRANSIELSEIEKGVGDNKIKVRRVEADVGELEAKVQRLKDNLIEFDANIEIQLVVQKRQIEIDLYGGRKDAENCNLMPREQVQEIVRQVIAAAENKLRVVEKVKAFNRILLVKEWKHEALKKEMLDCIEDFQDVRKFVVTKDTRALLENNLRAKSPQKFAREVEASKIVHEKALKKNLSRLENVESKIQSFQRQNKILEKKIVKMNGNRREVEDFGTDFGNLKVKILMKRSKVIREILEERKEIEKLKNEYRVQCERTIPFFGLIK